jgi:hypothetical protein
MNYFKPELLARCRSQDDDVAEEAAREWEGAIAAYEARLQSIRPRLAPSVRRLCSRYSLHDAKVLGATSKSRKPLFGILLQLEGVSGHSGEVLELNYQPVAGPIGGVHITTHPSLDSGSRREAWVLYDEVDFDEEHSFFTHSLLLTDGREIEVCFNKLMVRTLDEVLTPLQITEGERTWPPAEVDS